MSELDPATQYKTTKNLGDRGDFNARYSTFSWFEWIADHAPEPTGHVLDIGSGPGWFWASVSHRWAVNHLTLADISKAMLNAADARLSGLYQIETRQADIAALPFENASFDTVVAMHMLYHAKDPETALREIKRVLKPDGFAMITTVHDRDLEEIAAVSRAAFGSSGTDLITPVFGGTRAGALLRATFSSVQHHRCTDEYEIDDTASALAYITSFPPGISAPTHERNAFRDAFEAERLRQGGRFKATRRQDLFIARP